LGISENSESGNSGTTLRFITLVIKPQKTPKKSAKKRLEKVRNELRKESPGVLRGPLRTLRLF